MLRLPCSFVGEMETMAKEHREELAKSKKAHHPHTIHPFRRPHSTRKTTEQCEERLTTQNEKEKQVVKVSLLVSQGSQNGWMQRARRKTGKCENNRQKLFR